MTGKEKLLYTVYTSRLVIFRFSLEIPQKDRNLSKHGPQSVNSPLYIYYQAKVLAPSPASADQDL